MRFFFFKQKTAYEMRISDWSSDVCSSDLAAMRRFSSSERGAGMVEFAIIFPFFLLVVGGVIEAGRMLYLQTTLEHATRTAARAAIVRSERSAVPRSEEQTSELQSLMRTSYAVFCLKKKINHQDPNT